MYVVGSYKCHTSIDSIFNTAFNIHKVILIIMMTIMNTLLNRYFNIIFIEHHIYISYVAHLRNNFKKNNNREIQQ